MLRSFGGIADRLRAERLKLPRRRGRHDFLRRPDGGPATVLQGFSAHVLPDGLDYPPWVHTTGFWSLPAPPGWTPSPELASFLAAGDRPVYIGFGSMAGNDPERVGRVVAEADQPFWAARMHAAGAAPPPQPQRRLTAEGLAAALRQALDLEESAGRLGHLIRAEDGARRAVKILEALA
ncbi:hypothetical protein [Nonomuraea sp. NPDC050202]|uniref:hypothetical protein n=1 Tax=Nonomuraea sp. NPDC050202 TaxID=3155035 RepID=UPI0033E59FCA